MLFLSFALFFLTEGTFKLLQSGLYAGMAVSGSDDDILFPGGTLQSDGHMENGDVQTTVGWVSGRGALTRVCSGQSRSPDSQRCHCRIVKMKLQLNTVKVLLMDEPKLSGPSTLGIF